MQRQTKVAQPRLLQTAHNHLKSRCFFRNKQDSLSICHRFCNNIGNRLALAGSRRSLHNKADALFRKLHSFLLAGICTKHLITIARSNAVWVFSFQIHRRQSLFIAAHSPYDRITQRFVFMFFQIMIHADFKKRNQPKINFPEQLPSPLICDSFHLVHIRHDRILIFQFKRRKFYSIVLAEKEIQRRIYFDIVIISAEHIWRIDRFNRKRYRHHD